MIETDPYLADGLLAWNSTNVFYRQIRNLAIDTRPLPPSFPAIGIHWPSSQGSSISNCQFLLAPGPGSQHTGLFIESGSGGLLNDLYFVGGGKAAILGNQQYTARNIWFTYADVGIFMSWDWGWTYKSLYFLHCNIGIQMSEIAKSTGSILLIDSLFENVGTPIMAMQMSIGSVITNGTIVMENTRFLNVSCIVGGPNGTIMGPQAVIPGNNQLFVMVSDIDLRDTTSPDLS